MRIGILGTGAMATALGTAWVRAGHDVWVGGRDTEAASRTARRTGASGHGSLAEAAAHGEVVLTAVPADAAPQLAKELAHLLAGRTLIDCTVPMAPGADGPALTTGGGATSVAWLVADAAPGAHVVKAFGVCHDSIWTLDRPVFEGAPLAVPFCTDQPGAATRVAELIASMGARRCPAAGSAVPPCWRPLPSSPSVSGGRAPRPASRFRPRLWPRGQWTNRTCPVDHVRSQMTRTVAAAVPRWTQPRLP
ncbi:NAD(P)-binding domain-containing protein [Streptomyces sp. NBC_01481]|uniref:NADPH-dependent F420 reductase n=1 Tax=Streptomyces sp. NBC_01481 TaxID=2975869 RepID=UPI002B1CD61B|nr:NAD(P)-binding domain-containing protein [Streptomyces sp. NBC_01481]